MRSFYLILVYASIAVAQIQRDHFTRELKRSTHGSRQEDISHVFRRTTDTPGKSKIDLKDQRSKRSPSPAPPDHPMSGARSASPSPSAPHSSKSGSQESMVREFSRQRLDSGSEMSIDSARSKSPRRSDPTSFEAQGRIPSITSSKAPTLRRLGVEEANASTPSSLRSNASSGRLDSAVHPQMARYSPYSRRATRARASPISSPTRTVRTRLRALRIDHDNDVQPPDTPTPRSSSYTSSGGSD